jgi:hypothetical protein
MMAYHDGRLSFLSERINPQPCAYRITAKKMPSIMKSANAVST